MNAPSLVTRWEPLDRLACVLLFGYLLLGRSFAYIGVPPLFIGEISLAAYLVLRPRGLVLPWLGSLTSRAPLSAVSWWLAVSLTFAAAQCFRALLAEDLTMATLQNAVFHFYPLFLFPGIYVGVRHPDFLPRLIRALAWCNGLYGLAYIAVLSPLGLTANLEDTRAVAWFGQPSAGAAAVLGLLATSGRMAPSIIPLLLNLLVLLGMQRRAEWLSIFVGVALWSSLSGKLTRLLSIGALVAALLLIGLVIDVKVPSPQTRGGEISARNLIARALAPINEEAASQLSPDAAFYASTASWRSEWWKVIWDRVHSSPAMLILGAGYHDRLWELHPEDLRDEPVRTPHNIFMFILGYTGWLGIVVFYGLQLALARLMWQAYRVSGNPFGFCYWVLVMVWAVFDTFLETPFEGIPTYLLLGLAAAPVFAAGARGTPSGGQRAAESREASL